MKLMAEKVVLGVNANHNLELTFFAQEEGELLARVEIAGYCLEDLARQIEEFCK